MLKKTFATGIAAAGIVAAAGAAPALAAPLDVPQVPLTATQVAGMFPQPFTTRIGADTTGRPGEVRIAAYSSIGYNSYGSLVRIDYRNTRTGTVGSVTVKPFTQGQFPQSATATPGSGKVTYTARFVSSGTVATVILPTPGSGSFQVP